MTMEMATGPAPGKWDCRQTRQTPLPRLLSMPSGWTVLPALATNRVRLLKIPACIQSPSLFLNAWLCSDRPGLQPPLRGSGGTWSAPASTPSASRKEPGVGGSQSCRGCSLSPPSRRLRQAPTSLASVSHIRLWRAQPTSPVASPGAPPLQSSDLVLRPGLSCPPSLQTTGSIRLGGVLGTSLAGSFPSWGPAWCWLEEPTQVDWIPAGGNGVQGYHQAIFQPALAPCSSPAW